LRKIVRRHKGRVKAWEIWNEPHAGYLQGSTEQYFELLKSGYETIKAEDPEAIVAGGAMTGNFMGFAKKLFRLGAHKYMDALTVHFYLQKAPEKEILLASFRQLKEAIAKTGKDLSIWDGESSYCIPLRNKNCQIKPVPYGIEKLISRQNGRLFKTPGERRAAAYSVRQRVIELSLGIKRFFTFNTYAMPFGAYTLNLVAREAMVKNLGDRKFQQNIDLGASHLWGRLFGDSGCTAVLWSTCGEQDIILDCDAEKVVISDFLGNTREAAGKTCKITLSDYPVYILGCGPKISVGSQLFTLKSHAERAVIGDDFTVTISNRQSHPVNMGLSILDFKGQKVASADSISLAGGASKTLTLPVATKATAGSGEIAIFANDGSGKKTRHSFPVKLALAPIVIPRTDLTLPSLPPTGLKPQIRLGKEGQVKVGLRDQAIDEKVPYWRGVEDLSGQATLAWNSKGLYLSVDVTDDQFLSDPDQQPFLNDSIELFLDLRNPPGDGNYDSGVFHYAVRLLPDGKTKTKDYAPGAGTNLNINAKWEKSSKGYRFTAFIPIPAKFKLKPGREIGFDLAINDADPKRNNNKRVSQLIWQGAADNYRNASLFGVLKLK